jgi:hypothetical protein
MGGEFSRKMFFVHLSLRWSIPEKLISGQDKEAENRFENFKKDRKIICKIVEKLLTVIGLRH